MVLDLFNDPFFSTFFYGYPKETKPPYEMRDVYIDKSLKGWQITYALAGFKEEFIKVWSKRRELFVEGNNDQEESYAKGTKFACSFKQKFLVSDKLDLSKMSVDFEDGLLMIFIPVKEEVDSDTVF